MRDTLAKATSEALLDWLQDYYGKSLAKLPLHSPIWVSLAKGPSHGQKLGIQAIADVCQKYLGTSKVHTMRHTFAQTSGVHWGECEHHPDEARKRLFVHHWALLGTAQASREPLCRNTGLGSRH